MLAVNNSTLLKELNMPTCSTPKTITKASPIHNLILPISDTESYSSPSPILPGPLHAMTTSKPRIPLNR
jgi:hypothetical protein